MAKADKSQHDSLKSRLGGSAANTTRLALDRTFLANERTYQAWIRTGVSTFAAGLGVARFLKDDLPVGLLLIIAAILLLFSAASFLHAAWRYGNFHIRMADLDIDGTPVWVVRLFSIILASCSVLALIGLLITTEL
jgi:putative membrane protein